MSEHPARVGHYDIEQYLGGGMARVYRAKHMRTGQRVAIKLLAEAANNDPDVRARFLREAEVAASITHENIIAVMGHGEEHLEGTTYPFMVMEFLEGETMRESIALGHAPDLLGRLRIAQQLARALLCIHLRKIVHRDIKPENVHIDATGHAKLIDFGIAKAEGARLTRTGVALGTPYYMAPEQVSGERVGPHTDVYGFGVLLYEWMSGVRAVKGENLEQVFNEVLNVPLDTAPLHAAKVPVAVVDLILRCAAKQRADRPAGFGEICEIFDWMLADPSHLNQETPRRPRNEATASEEPEEHEEGWLKKIGGMFGIG